MPSSREGISDEFGNHAHAAGLLAGLQLSVADQLERGELTHPQAQARYGIRGRTTAVSWPRMHDRKNGRWHIMFAHDLDSSASQRRAARHSFSVSGPAVRHLPRMGEDLSCGAGRAQQAVRSHVVSDAHMVIIESTARVLPSDAPTRMADGPAHSTASAWTKGTRAIGVS